MSYAVENYNRILNEAFEAFNNQDFASALSRFESCYSYIEMKNVSVSKEGEWEVQFWIALCETYLGNYYAALRTFIIILDQFEAVKSALSERKYHFDYHLYYNAATVYEHIGQWLNTQEMLELAIKTKYAEENSDERISIIWYLGDVHREKGEYDQALKYYQETMNYYQTDDPLQIFQLNTDIAKLHNKQGDRDKALSLLKENLKLNEALEDPDPYIESRSVEVLADIIIEILSEGKFPDSLELFSYIEKLILKQLSSIEPEEIPLKKVMWLARLSKLSSLVGKTEIYNNIDLFLQETDLKTTSPLATPDYFKNLVQIYQNLADYYFENIIENGTNLHNLKTLELYKKLDDSIDRATYSIMSPTPQRDYHIQFTYVGYRIFNLYQLIYEDYWEDFLYESLGMVEKYKGYDLFLTLEDAINRKDYWEKLNELEYEIIIKTRQHKSEKDETIKKELKNHIEQLQNRYYDIENEMIVTETRKLSDMKEDPAKLMIKVLEPLEPLFNKFRYGILYFAMDQNILYIVGFAKNLVVREIIEFDQAKLNKAEALLAYLREGAASISSKDDIINLDKILKKLSAFFSNKIMTPQIIALLQKIEYLTIIPSGLFINYPIEILRAGDEYLGLTKKLSREFNLKLLSLQYKNVVEKKWYQHHSRTHGTKITNDLDILHTDKDIVFISNPNFEEFMVIPESEIELNIVSKEVIETGQYENSNLWNMDLGKTEVQSLISLFKEKNVQYNALIDNEISKEKLMEILTNKVKIFHFAGHALFDDETPQLSKLVLRHSKVMTPMDLQKFKFENNPLIIFSACESGVSEVKLGDEPFGFLRFTKIMNGQNIIFSLWPVLSRPTTRLMILFYERLLSGYSIAEAMRDARIQLVNEVKKDENKLGYYADFELIYWSPFSFIGMPFYNYQVEV